ncbi:uncharacterized protein PHALS_15102 [Plasmopara halstedii]|uniref:Uncharacterized protein n=1 Tax=Plasmopara halstedii TaxID=4781 RepID=A0A0P1B792_PLAHL|nr:uncharacterized protein PHALS_15102 [Plasmopara halstedii]CEG50448.1 hypothetical protein PHALS_15102 [Plasmopara halstedii]|eukprot:XP_024586817.1 hypothetical protein PHALS_15102 [Plasmopara halstedii]
MLESLLHRFFKTDSSLNEVSTVSDKSGEQISQETVFTREADVEGWVFLAEERHLKSGSKPRSFADVVATGRL